MKLVSSFSCCSMRVKLRLKLRVFAVATKYGIEGHASLARQDNDILAINASLPP
jgi:hypothetical protein